jgi:hypothetical protein
MKTTSAVLATIALLVAGPAAAQQRPTITPPDYGRWEALGPATLSPDGAWLTYQVRRVNEATRFDA